VRPLVAAARGRVPHLSRHGLVHDDLGLGGYSLTELVDGFFWARALCRHVKPLTSAPADLLRFGTKKKLFLLKEAAFVRFSQRFTEQNQPCF
jgi:hypothetical protein